MRRLKKGQPLVAFTEWCANNAAATWKDFSGGNQSLSQEVRLHILCEEQDELCGYTELPINDPFNCHIDHYRKTNLFVSLTFEWNNFIVATMDDDFGARYKDMRSGIKATEYQLVLCPITDHVESYFEYTLTGDIIPKRQGLNDSEKAMAQRTIDIFNLKHPSLTSRRKALIEMIEAYGDLPTDEIKSYLTGFGFKSLIEQFT